MNNKLFVMNYSNEQVGFVERIPGDDGKFKFRQELNGEITIHDRLPLIMCDIAPEPTQLPHIPAVFEYYRMKKLDVWEYIAKSNGIHSGHDYWFLSEPVGEVWIPLVVGMQKYQRYGSWFKAGDEILVERNGRIKVNYHRMEVLPKCIIERLPSMETDVTGIVYDVVETPSIRGLIGRIILNFPE